MSATVIRPGNRPAVHYLLRLGDTCLIHAQRLSEWCGHAPVLEEDVALSNIALDWLGHAREVLKLAAERDGQGYDEDTLAFWRDESHFFNLTVAELPRGDFADVVVRNLLLSTFFKHLWTRLHGSTDAPVAALAHKAIKEIRYHQRHAVGWLLRLGLGTAESHRRTNQALTRAWAHVDEMFDSDEVDDAACLAGLGPRWIELRQPWLEEVVAVLQAADLNVPDSPPVRSQGRPHRHTEHMGYLLCEMQHLHRSFPGARW